MNITRSAAAAVAALLIAATVPAGAQAPADSPHGKLSLGCSTCHNTGDWSVAPRPPGFDHGRSGFPLVGRHEAVKCRDCHRDLAFGHVASACVDCHQDVHRGQLGPRCDRCHSPAGWESRGQLFEQHAARGFPLIGVHAAADCEACHTGQQRQDFVGTPVVCFGCHAGDYARTANAGIPHAQVGFGTNCEQCHAPTAAWGPVTWDHAVITGFALTGRHTAITCVACHPGGQWAGRPRDCAGCHQPDYQATANPPHAAASFATTCETCHTTAGWQPTSWNHSVNTAFALTGAHVSTTCISCHANGRWVGTPQDCWSCHAADFNGTTSPPHAAANMPHDCTQCHTTANWGSGTFDHAASTGFALTGAHANATCTSCHANGRWAGTPADCNGCHAANYAATTVPAHGASGFPTTCQTCHTTTAWQPSSWAHASTGFTLTGAHVAASCTSCHANNQWPGLATDCYSCHVADFNATTDPPHVTSNIPHDCAQCHSTTNWGGGTFDHAVSTGFALTGAHTTLTCVSCHANGRWAGTPTDCNGCHAANYAATTVPAHGASGFATTCQTCHTTTAWQPSSWLHASTGFTLTGAHLTTSCTACHANNQWPGLATDCYGCHTADFNAATAPPHVASSIPHDCTQCHTTATWGSGTFDHTASTGFALTGAHTSLTCVSCHANGRWAGTPTDCNGCHAANYAATTVPAHGASGFATTCQTCHTTTAWQPSSWLHASTGFILTGAHTTTSCTLCHANNQWPGLATDCYSCHIANFNATTDPPHVASNIPHDCTQCHTTASWGSGTFNHAASTGFALTGAHATASCTTCHANGRWAGTPTDCNGCHAANYAATTVPAHGASGFATTCQTCHTTTAWQPSSWLHASTGFTLTGAHTTTSCTLCHANNQWPGLATDCYSCHIANFNATTDPPHVASNIPHDCTQCHTTASWGSGTFNHAASTGFALTGAHATASCTTCHANGRWAGTPTDCNGCHAANYDGTANPAHAAASFPRTCQTCHTTTAWQPSTWNHTLYFPISSGNHNLSCVSCHLNPNDYSLFECITCHTHSQANTDGHHSDVANYQWVSSACYRCHPTGRAGK